VLVLLSARYNYGVASLINLTPLIWLLLISVAPLLGGTVIFSRRPQRKTDWSPVAATIKKDNNRTTADYRKALELDPDNAFANDGLKRMDLPIKCPEPYVRG